MAVRVVSPADARVGDEIQRLNLRGGERVATHPLFVETVVEAGPTRLTTERQHPDAFADRRRRYRSRAALAQLGDAYRITRPFSRASERGKR